MATEPKIESKQHNEVMAQHNETLKKEIAKQTLCAKGGAKLAPKVVKPTAPTAP